MIGIFTKPLETVDAADLVELCERRWPEGYTVEFKRTLPHRQGREDAWIAGGNRVEEYAYEKIFAEIVAFANGQGGTLVLGIAETKDKPPCADIVNPVPRVGELARRFDDKARTAIDPPLPRLHIRPIETEAGAGAIVFRLGPSRSAPHRLTSNGRSYRRHGASTIEMNMREIQDMTLNVARGTAGIKAAFAERRAAFQEWGNKSGQTRALGALRITAIPLEPMLDLGRLFGRRDLWPQDRRYKISVGGTTYEVVTPAQDTSERPILRGTSHFGDASFQVSRREIHQDGKVDIWIGRAPRPLPGSADAEELLILYHGWTLGAVLEVLTMVDLLRTESGAPEAEYGVEIEIVKFGANKARFAYIEFGGGAMGGQYLIQPPIFLPPLVVGGTSTFEQALNSIDVDMFDAIGIRREKPAPLKLTS